MKLKVCGMKYDQNIWEVAALHPEFIGFIFYPDSPRYVGDDFDITASNEIPKEINKVGVFVNASEKFILAAVSRNKLDFVQLHGSESAAFCRNISSGIRIIKAFGIHDNFDFHVLDEYKSCCTYFLFDTKSNSFGGSGKRFDWELLKKYDQSIPYFLSGGIGMESIPDLNQLHPFALDVNSKFETEPGWKNATLLKKFKNAIQASF